jgi:DNA-binding transcriptional MerR regulator
MSESSNSFIQLTKVSELFHIREEVCREFAEFGLVRISFQENTPCFSREEIPRLLHIIHLYRDLGVNKEGIEVILPMRERIIHLQEKIETLTREIERLEGEYFQKNVELPRKRGQFFEL